jgi:hypothetical protein
MALHLHRRAPFIGIAHDDADFGFIDGGIEELVAAPGIGGEHAAKTGAGADHRIGKAARRRRQHRRAAAAVACAPIREASISG